MKVILDNGHGVHTPGKRSPIWEDGTQLFEYEFNRDVALSVSIELSSKGIPVEILVPEITDISLQERVKRANLIYANDKTAFLVSIHANAGGGTGWEIFTSRGQTKSDVIASFLYGAAKGTLPAWTKFRTDFASDNDADKEAGFYMLRKTHCPAVLTENYFMDTEKDCKYIMSEEGREAIVKYHVDGIMEYIKSLTA